ncbi:MAG: VWA domain-containing protein [Gemmatimonadaceae bacterium]
MTPFAIDWTWMLGGAGALMLLGVALVLLAARRKRARLARLAEPAMVARIAPAHVVRGAGWRSARLGSALLLAGVAIAGPRWGAEPALVTGEGIDVVLALDASLSMLATDERPNRLERLKQEVRRYRDLAHSDRIAMLAFAGRSYILTPLTVDDGALELFLDNLDPSIVGQAGSSLARTITQGTDLLLSSKTSSDRALVIMSDGEAFEDPADMREAAARAAQNGIVIVTVGFGTPGGSTIPVTEGNSTTPKRDENGEIVVTRYNADNLRLVAEAGKGTFIDAAETDKATRVRAALQNLRTASRSVSSASLTLTARFQWFVAAALLVLMLDMWRSERRRGGRVRAATALAGTALLAGCTCPGGTAAKAAREYAVQRYPRAVALYRHAIAQGDARPEMMYNLGTALVAADSLDAAMEPLERAAKSEDAEIRYRSHFNSGFGTLVRGLLGDAEADSTKAALTATLASYKRVLLMRPTDRDAKWNYELALRKQEENSGGGGGGGGGGGNSDANDPEQGEADTPEAARQSGGLGEQQAEQLLNAAAREERGVQGRKQRQNRPQPPPGGKDW